MDPITPSLTPYPLMSHRNNNYRIVVEIFKGCVIVYVMNYNAAENIKKSGDTGKKIG